MSAKLPIPRLRRERREKVAGRVSRACEPCRERKNKCDGSRPACSQCRAQGLDDCYYPERKVVRQEKELGSMQKEIENYRELLEDIYQSLKGPIAGRVAKALKGPKQAKKNRSDRRPSSPSSSSLASLEQTSVVNEDLNRSEKSRATGYMGQNSEVAWMQRLDFQASKQSDEEVTPSLTSQFQFPIDDSIASMNYHLDYQSIPEPDKTNAFVLPPKALADRLLQVYLEEVHISLPIIRSDLLVAQYNRCYSEGKNPGRKWLAVFNMILAIACALSRLCVLEIPQGADENLFTARARSLSLSENVLYDHDDLQQVQAEALMAFYFLIQSQINRSWKMIGIASRSGIALGLNLEKRINGLDVKSGEARKQLWWSIFRLENLLSIMTGRVSCHGTVSYSVSPPILSPDLDITVPDIDQPINELQWTIHMGKEQMDSQGTLLKSLASTQALYFFYMVDLTLISHDIINEVYAIDSSRAGWGRVESRIAFYSKKLDHWASTIHPSFCFQRGQINPLLSSSLFRFSLALNYYSAHILLNRPCLNSPAFEKKNGSRGSSERFANAIAFSCLRASLAVIALLPDQPDLAWCYKIPQWWSLLHILTQSTVILLLNISIGPVPTRLEEIELPVESVGLVWAGVKKGLSWLHCLGRTSEAARRAFQFFDSCIHRMVPSKDLELEGIPSAIESSQTSRDPKFPWFRDSSEGNAASLQQENEAIDNPGYSKPMDSPNNSARKAAMLFQDLQGVQYSMMPRVSGVLDAEEKVSELVANPDVAIEDILFAMVDFNA